MFESPTTLPTARSSLLAVSTKYGLTFIGCPTGILKLLYILKWRMNIFKLCVVSFLSLLSIFCFLALKIGMCTYWVLNKMSTSTPLSPTSDQDRISPHNREGGGVLTCCLKILKLLFFLSELNFLSSLLLVTRVMYLSRSRQKVRLYLFVYQGENWIKTIISTLFFNFFLITIVLYIISILNSRLYIIQYIASLFVVTGTRVIKTETIERINESDEGSMQNVGKLLKEPS